MAPLPESDHAPAVGSYVDVIGGNYRGRRCRVVGESREFWELRSEASGPSFRARKSNVREVGGEGAPEEDNDENEFEDCLSGDNPAAEESSPKEEALLRSHSLSILSWNTGRLSFMGGRQESPGEHVEHIAMEIARQGIEVVVLQEVPKVQGPSRVQALRERFNEALLRTGVRKDSLFGEPAFSAKAEGREIHALLCRSPVRLDQTATLTEVRDLSFKYPPLMALLRDDRFCFHSLRRMVLTSAHTPGSADLQRSRQRALEVNRLLSDLPSEAASRININGSEALLFSDLRLRKKADAAKACALPFILCGDFNIDFFKSECGMKPDLRDEFFEGLDLRALQSVNRVEAHTASGCWVGGAPPGRVTSCGGRCLDFFFWNADSAKRAEFTVRPMHLSQEAVKKAGHPGLSDHDAVVLEVREDPVHRHQARAAGSRREE